MGSGKSTIGKQLSKIVGIPFYDLDKIIEESENDTIKNIFKSKGEIYFRKIESILFKSFVNNTNDFVLALGGGTPCYGTNFEVLQNEAVHSFYLKGSVTTLTGRLFQERENRPLIATLTTNELEDYIRKHLFDRSYYYLKSKYVVTIDEKSIDEINNEIVKELT